MVLRENLDFNKISIDNFKTFNCLCELCDCGCFDRTKQKHIPNCPRNTVQKVKASYSAVTPGKCALSHYKDTFKFVPNARPATTVQPPPGMIHEGIPKGSFDFNTVQKLEFKPYEFKPRAQPFSFPDNHEFSKAPVSGITSYIADFKNKGVGNFPERIKKDPNQVT